ncbi:MAG: carbamoyltransferase C-terminal domain-containing protein [Candidatus Omnitrophota bacterium]|jgi:carbamoyltransferase
MIILGLNAYHPDSSVALVKDGVLLWGAEEERYSRVKHASGFPKLALQACLRDTGVLLEQIDVVAIGKNPRANLLRKVLFSLKNWPSLDFLMNRVRAFRAAARFEEDFKAVMAEIGFPLKACGDDKTSSLTLPPPQGGRKCLPAKFIHVEHHLAHAASAFYASGFEGAAFLSLDGLGDFSAAMWGYGDRNDLHVLNRVYFPHSVGFFYTAGTQFLGFLSFGDEYKVMGLAAYGKPVYTKQFEKMVILKPDGRFELNLDYFMQHKGQSKIRWEGGRPEQDILYSSEWMELFGVPRSPDGPLTQKERDMASSMQVVVEEIYFHVLNHLYQTTKMDNLCMAGGVAYNSVANGKIRKNTPFKNIYIPPAAGDAGTAIGAALYAYHQALGSVKTGDRQKKQNVSVPCLKTEVGPATFVMSHALYGSEFSDDAIEAILKERGMKYKKLPEEDMIIQTAKALKEKKVVGWFQGRMEFGPRSLGNRSILADPRQPDMKDILNHRIKHREGFRPFAPAVPEEHVNDYFEMDCASSPFMLKVFPVKPEKRSILPAITHVDGSARVQTVSQKEHPLFWKLITEFGNLTGVYVLLNTSFNENEPVVCRPEEAIDCFLKTKMDVLVLGHCFIAR